MPMGGSSSERVGDIKFHGRAALDGGWLWCDGSVVSRATYAALFLAIGTTFGAGDGSTTFSVPDMRGRHALGKDNMGGSAANRVTSGGSGIAGTTLGATGGAETVALSIAQLAAHTHTYPGKDATAGAPPLPATVGGTIDSNPLTSSTGSGSAHQNMTPSLVLNYVIKA